MYYVYPDPDLPYEGASELERITRLSRAINAYAGWPNNTTRRLSIIYNDTNSKYLITMSDTFYATLVSAGVLNSYEQTNSVTSAPTGFLINSNAYPDEVRPWVNNVYVVIGDSQIAGTTHTDAQKCPALLINSTGATYLSKEAYNATEQALNLGLSASGFVVTSTSLTWNTIYDWRVKDLTFAPNQNVVFIVALGTNDLTMTDSTGAGVWDNAKIFYGKLRTDFPDIPIVHATLPARNAKTVDYNNAARADWSNYVDAIADVGAITELLDTNYAVVTADLTYYQADGLHLQPGTATPLQAACIKLAADALLAA